MPSNLPNRFQQGFNGCIRKFKIYRRKLDLFRQGGNSNLDQCSAAWAAIKQSKNFLQIWDNIENKSFYGFPLVVKPIWYKNPSHKSFIDSMSTIVGDKIINLQYINTALSNQQSALIRIQKVNNANYLPSWVWLTDYIIWHTQYYPFIWVSVREKRLSAKKE